MATPKYQYPDSQIWDRNLLAKYDVPGPRYTSYPTALQFQESFKTQQFENYIQTLDATSAPLSLYVHIPFCEDICYYCACNKVVTKQKSKAREYLNYLEKEIELRSKLHSKDRKIIQMHWGGGTPTFLNTAELTELMYVLSRHFSLTNEDTREYSIEIDPRTVTSETLALIKGIGFNRLSFGIQDFDPFVQHAINRTQSFVMVKSLMEAARSYHFKSINFDLIYGLPHQNITSLTETLKKVIELSPDRIATYNYAHLPNRFKAQKQIDKHTLPSAEEKLQMLSLINTMLTDNRYVFIGMDHFAKPDDTLTIAQQQGHLQRNFQGYSTNIAHDLVGLGVSSISQINQCYAQNSKDLTEYYASLNNNTLPIDRGLICSDDDVLRNGVIMQLICNFNLELDIWNREHGVNFQHYFAEELKQLKTFELDNLLTISNTGIHILDTGKPFIRNICMTFDKYLSNEQSIRFSKTL